MTVVTGQDVVTTVPMWFCSFCRDFYALGDKPDFCGDCGPGSGEDLRFLGDTPVSGYAVVKLPAAEAESVNRWEADALLWLSLVLLFFVCLGLILTAVADNS